ncbi:MAG: hypothetical protein JSV84_15630 [Gemmatimonadota bacterium]|nr:MAG: hypothetical protein JSV84_15630 [Gemmatimonadota bacterium]
MTRKFLLFSGGLLVSIFVINAHAQDVYLKVMGGGGWPGSTDNVVSVYLRNERYIRDFDFNIIFDVNVLQIKEVTYGERGRCYWEIKDDGIYFQTGGSLGLGIFANIIIDVAANASVGEYPFKIYDFYINPDTLTVLAEDGVFSVNNAVLSSEFRGGISGGMERKVPIELKSDQNASGCEFNLKYDTDVLTVVDVLPTDYAQWEFSWSAIGSGIRLFKTTGPEVLGLRSGPICDVILIVAEGTTYGEYNIGIDNIVLTDTPGNNISAAGADGFFAVPHGVITFMNGGGFPGSAGNKVEVHIENDTQLAVIFFDLYFDTSNLNVLNLRHTERSKSCIGFSWSTIDKGIRLVAWDCHGGPMNGRLGNNLQMIWPDTGSVCEIYFDVADDAPLGEYNLDFFGAELGDPPGHHLLTVPVDGIFSVLSQGDVNGDEDVNVIDLIFTINIMLDAHKPNLTEFSMADCFDDDEVNILDVMCIVNIILETASCET